MAISKTELLGTRFGKAAWRSLRDKRLRSGLDAAEIDLTELSSLADTLSTENKVKEAEELKTLGEAALALRVSVVGR